MNDFYNIYTNNKNEYTNLNSIDKLNELCICHYTSRENLHNIILSGKIFPGKDVPIERRRMSGGIPQNYVFTVIMPKSSIPNFGCCIVFDINILLKYPFIFNPGWISEPNDKSIIVSSEDNIYKKIKKIKKMVKIVKKSDFSLMTQEILFYSPLSLKDSINIISR